MAMNKTASQQLLFPAQVELPKADIALLKGMQEDLETLGVQIKAFNDDHVEIQGLPGQAEESSAEKLICDLLESQKNSADEHGRDRKEALASRLARSMAIPAGKKLTEEEMNDIIDRLFACEMPYYTASGKPTVITFSLEELDKRFDK